MDALTAKLKKDAEEKLSNFSTAMDKMLEALVGAAIASERARCADIVRAFLAATTGPDNFEFRVLAVIEKIESGEPV